MQLPPFPFLKMASTYEPPLPGLSTQNSDDMPVIEHQYVDEELSLLRILAQLRQRVSDLEGAHLARSLNGITLSDIQISQEKIKAGDADIQTSQGKIETRLAIHEKAIPIGTLRSSWQRSMPSSIARQPCK